MSETISVTITGTGTPLARPGIAGPGVLVQAAGVALQFDAGRATVLRLAECGFDLTDLTAVFLTHHHSDHLVGLADLLMTRWLSDIGRRGQGSLPVIAPAGEASEIAEHVLDVWRNEIELRAVHTNRLDRPFPSVHRFAAPLEPTAVFQRDDVAVSAMAVRHEPVEPAVAYRVDAGAASVVISGDTKVCAEIEELARGANVLVHEAFRKAGTAGMLSDPERLAAYHADTVELGAMAERAGVGTLMLTHLIPPLRTREDKALYETDVRDGGFTGIVIVAQDLETVAV